MKDKKNDMNKNFRNTNPAIFPSNKLLMLIAFTSLLFKQVKSQGSGSSDNWAAACYESPLCMSLTLGLGGVAGLVVCCFSIVCCCVMFNKLWAQASQRGGASQDPNVQLNIQNVQQLNIQFQQPSERLPLLPNSQQQEQKKALPKNNIEDEKSDEKRKALREFIDNSGEYTIDVKPNDLNKFLCSITGEIMKDPVIATDGHTYERTAIEKWFKICKTSPVTGKVLSSTELISNHALRDVINSFDVQKKENKAMLVTDNKINPNIIFEKTDNNKDKNDAKNESLSTESDDKKNLSINRSSNN